LLGCALFKKKLKASQRKKDYWFEDPTRALYVPLNKVFLLTG
jgi:hypothetical protein